MPNNEQFDFLLGGRGFMLARGRSKGRAWKRSSVASVPGRASPDEGRFGTTAPDLQFREVFDDFSGGDGHAYRAVAPPNGVHWSENFDLRFPGQAVHCQALMTLTVSTRTAPIGADTSVLFDVPLPGVTNPPPGTGALLLAQLNALGVGAFDVWAITPATVGSGATPPFDGVDLVGDATTRYGGRPASFGSFHYVPTATGDSYFQHTRSLTTSTEISWNGGGRHFVNSGGRPRRPFPPPPGGA